MSPRKLPPLCRPAEDEPVRKQSAREETRIAKMTNQRLTPNSGSRPFVGMKGDMSGKKFRTEHKYTDNKSFSLTRKVLEKIGAEAIQSRMEPLLIVTFRGPRAPAMAEDYAVLPLDTLKEIMDAAGLDF